MIGEVCERFGWTVEYTLSMPASQFFVMLNSARKLRARHFTDLAWVSRGSQMTTEGFMELLSIFDVSERTIPEAMELPKPTLQASSDDARYAVMSAFSADTRIDRTVRVH